MTPPTTATELLIVLACVVPGAVFQVVLARQSGEVRANQPVPNRILRALVSSLVFDSVYAVALGSQFFRLVGLGSGTARDRGEWLAAHPRLDAAAALLLLFVLPSTLAWLIAHRNHIGARGIAALQRLCRGTGNARGAQAENGILARFQRRFTEASNSRFDPTPTAWDWALAHAIDEDGFVRVATPNGWHGGRYTERSFFADYPAEPAVFVEEAWQLSDDGTFIKPQEGTIGVWIPCNDACAVEFLLARDALIEASPVNSEDLTKEVMP